MTSPNTSSRSTPDISRHAAYVMLILAWLIGAASLVAFYGLFLFFGAPNLVDLGLSEPARLGWDALLCLAFFVQHSGMVRASTRHRLAAFVPRYLHGVVYSISSGIALIAVLGF